MTRGRAVLAQKEANVGACFPIRNKDDNRSVEFKIVQRALNNEMTDKERQLSCSQAKKSVVDSMIYSGKRTVTGEMKLIESDKLDATIASFFHENAFAFKVADSPSFCSSG